MSIEAALREHVPLYDFDVSCEGPVGCSCGYETAGVNEERWESYVDHVVSLVDDSEPLALRDARAAERESAEADGGVIDVRTTYGLADLPMGGCSTATAHNAHLAAGDPLCENQRGGPLAALRHHVTGKVESGDAEPIEAVEVADHPFVGTERVPGYCKRCGCADWIHPVAERCPHGRTVASRRDEPCPPGLPGCRPLTNNPTG